MCFFGQFFARSNLKVKFTFHNIMFCRECKSLCLLSKLTYDRLRSIDRLIEYRNEWSKLFDLLVWSYLFGLHYSRVFLTIYRRRRVVNGNRGQIEHRPILRYVRGGKAHIEDKVYVPPPPPRLSEGFKSPGFSCH